MNLYVLGSYSPIPDDWSSWDEICLVIAPTKEEALKLSPTYHTTCTKIPMDKSLLLISMPEPSFD